jgi:hypothetical protein
VQEVLAAGGEEVRACLDRAIRSSGDLEGRVLLRSLAGIRSGSGPKAPDASQLDGFVEAFGAVLVTRAQYRDGPSRDPEVGAGIGTGEFPPAGRVLRPDGRALFDSTVRTEGWLAQLLSRQDSALDRTLGLAIGEAAKGDPKLVEDLLARVGKVELDEALGRSSERALVYAAGRLGSETACRVLVGLFRRCMAMEEPLPRSDRLSVVGEALHASADDRRLLALRDEADAAGDWEFVSMFDMWVGGNAPVDARLREARKANSPMVLRGLALSLFNDYGALPSLDRRLAAAEFAEALLAGQTDPGTRPLAEAVLHACLWPGYFGPGANRFCELSSQVAFGSPPGRRITVSTTGEGGFPDPRSQVRRLREEVAGGRLVVEGRPWAGFDPFEGVVEIDGGGEKEGQPARVGCRRAEGKVVVTILNTSREPLLLNTLATSFVVAQRYGREGAGAAGPGFSELRTLRLCLGRILPDDALVAAPAALTPIAPGASLEFAVPLKTAGDSTGRIVVEFRDMAAVLEEHAGRRITAFGPVVVP